MQKDRKFEDAVNYPVGEHLFNNKFMPRRSWGPTHGRKIESEQPLFLAHQGGRQGPQLPKAIRSRGDTEPVPTATLGQPTEGAPEKDMISVFFPRREQNSEPYPFLFLI